MDATRFIAFDGGIVRPYVTPRVCAAGIFRADWVFADETAYHTNTKDQLPSSGGRRDKRRSFLETFRSRTLAGLGFDHDFVQENHSRSRRGIVRGMHYQPGQAKLVRCARGAILDILVDIRRGSPQFGQWEGFTLDDVTHRQLYVPHGFAHGFSVLSELADVTYKVSTYYDPSSESVFAYDDPAVGISEPRSATDWGRWSRTSRTATGARSIHLDDLAMTVASFADPRQIVEIGCGDGAVADRLCREFPEAESNPSTAR